MVCVEIFHFLRDFLNMSNNISTDLFVQNADTKGHNELIFRWISNNNNNNDTFSPESNQNNIINVNKKTKAWNDEIMNVHTRYTTEIRVALEELCEQSHKLLQKSILNVSNMWSGHLICLSVCLSVLVSRVIFPSHQHLTNIYSEKFSIKITINLLHSSSLHILSR